MIESISKYSNRELFLIALVIIIGIYLLKTFWNSDALNNSGYQFLGAKSNDGSKVKDLTPEMKKTLEEGAIELKALINEGGGAQIQLDSSLSAINKLNDAQFIYMYEYYIKKYGENPFCAVDWELLPNTEEDEAFMTRAENLRLPIKNAGLFESC